MEALKLLFLLVDELVFRYIDALYKPKRKLSDPKPHHGYAA